MVKDERLRELAMQAVKGEIYTSLSVEDPHLLALVFLPLAMMSSEETARIDALPRDLQPGIFWAPWSSRWPGGQGINGHPMFSSVAYIPRCQMEEFRELAFEYQQKVDLIDKGFMNVNS